MRPTVALVALIASAGCKKKPPTPPPPPPPIPEPQLTIVSVSPPSVPPDHPQAVTVYGSAFESGVSVSFGETPAASVRRETANQLSVDAPGLALGDYDVTVQNPDGAERVLRAGLRVEPQGDPMGCEYVVLYFETNRSSLLPAAQRTLEGLVQCYEKTQQPVRVAGHADERGTTDFNLNLSYARALAVQEFLVGAGIPKARLPVTSYGEERPAVQGWGEQFWAQNRRVELTID